MLYWKSQADDITRLSPNRQMAPNAIKLLIVVLPVDGSMECYRWNADVIVFCNVALMFL